MADIVKGEDKKITITVKDADGVEIDLTTLNGYICVLYQVGLVVAQYSKNVQVDFDPLTELDQGTDTGKFEVNLQSAQTSLAIANKDLFAEVKIQTAQAGFDDSTFDQIVGKIKVGTIVDSQTKGDSV